MSSTNPQLPPYHKSEKMFRRYEQHIFTFLQRWPTSTAFETTPLSHTTFRCRFRDAATSVLEYSWPTSIDIARLREIWPTVELTVVDGLVVVQPKGTKNLSPAGSPTDLPEQTQELYLVELDKPEDIVVVALAVLFHNKVFNKPVKLKNVKRSLLDQIADKYDVGISDLPDGFVML